MGLVPFRDDVPRSGFIFQPDYLTPERLPALRNAWRLASYDSEPLAVPDAAPLPPEPVPVEAALRFGERDERFCYLRGETVPLYLRLRARQAAMPVKVDLSVRDGGTVLRSWQGEVQAKSESTDTLVAHVDLGGLRVGIYPVLATLTVGGATQRIERELRVSPAPDHSGTHVGLWVSTSPHLKRTDHLLRWLDERAIEPMFTDDNPLAHDLALWYGQSFSVRRHGEPQNIAEPTGYDEWRKSWNGEILRVGAQGGKRSSRGYASPFRRAAEAAAFAEGIAFDNRFPAFRKRAVTGDDYSQWFGMDYNRYAVEGFRARYGIDPPRPKEIEDSDEVDKVTRPPGIVPDDEPWLLLNRYWCQDIHADMAGRLAQAMRDHTDGTGRVGQISGGMQIPAMQLWSAQYPPFLFGPRGYNLTCFYYYNTYWQPPLAHLWWLECARMGNRSQEEWIMPDCYAEGDGSASPAAPPGWSTSTAMPWSPPARRAWRASASSRSATASSSARSTRRRSGSACSCPSRSWSTRSRAASSWRTPSWTCCRPRWTWSP
ncbi:MAG: hypothetical protein HYU66_22710 [Armatimonadetes bacterium]|nr:hypothetical protein [Armatimonadota bacterium]